MSHYKGASRVRASLTSQKYAPSRSSIRGREGVGKDLWIGRDWKREENGEGSGLGRERRELRKEGVGKRLEKGGGKWKSIGRRGEEGGREGRRVEWTG